MGIMGPEWERSSNMQRVSVESDSPVIPSGAPQARSRGLLSFRAKRGILIVPVEGPGRSAAAGPVASRESRVASRRLSLLSRECPSQPQSEGTGTEN